MPVTNRTDPPAQRFGDHVLFRFNIAGCFQVAVDLDVAFDFQRLCFQFDVFVCEAHQNFAALCDTISRPDFDQSVGGTESFFVIPKITTPFSRENVRPFVGSGRPRSACSIGCVVNET